MGIHRQGRRDEVHRDHLEASRRLRNVRVGQASTTSSTRRPSSATRSRNSPTLRAHNIRLGFYYSQSQDWHEPDGDGNTWDFGRPKARRTSTRTSRQSGTASRELLTNYGPVALIWFDTPRKITKEQSQQLADLVHSIQPDCLVSGRIGNNVGEYDSAGDNQISFSDVKRPWETPVTLNDTWGFKKDDNHWKEPSVLIRQLAQVASRGGNYLLNVGPTAEGVIPRPSIDRLANVGSWMKVNGDSIYGTSASPIPYELPWGVMTTKPGKLFFTSSNGRSRSLLSMEFAAR